jgi:hypothetical protein
LSASPKLQRPLGQTKAAKRRRRKKKRKKKKKKKKKKEPRPLLLSTFFTSWRHQSDKKKAATVWCTKYRAADLAEIEICCGQPAPAHLK